jgi:flagellar M-ring protein FliF
MARAGAAITGLGRPARILLGTTFAVIALTLAWLGYRSASDPYATLFGQLDRDDAGAIVAKLKEMKVPYRVGADGMSIEVPEAHVHELRLDLASSGLPRGGGVGFEGFDKMRLGATEFEQRVMYRRAMEGELARTIGSVDAVANARVHLVLPDKSVFAARREPASASVVIKTRPGRVMSPGEIAGVVHLVAAAVPGLTAERVSLVTTEGQVLHRPRTQGESGDDSSMDGEHASEARHVEQGIEENARAMLERVLGAGHVDVRARAELDFARTEHVEDRYDPTKTVLRSEEKSVERTSGQEDDTVAGVPGAESNLPTGKPADEAKAGAAGVVRESHTRNFEVDHIQDKRVSTTGSVRRLTVAVVVDGTPKPEGGTTPRSREELDRLASLVKSAVGADEKRGDVVTIESISFPVAEPIVAATNPPLIDTPAPVKKWLPVGVAGAAALLVLYVVLKIRKLAKARLARKTALELAQASSKPVGEPLLTAASAAAHAELASDRDLAALPSPILPEDQRIEALRRAKEDPATAALVLRRWLGTSAEESTPSKAA